MRQNLLSLFAVAALAATVSFAAPAHAGGSCSSNSMSTVVTTGYGKGGSSAANRSADIVHVAAQAGTFQTLLAAAKAAGLVEALSAKGPITLFAPTDAAFAKLPKGTVESLLEPQNKAKLVAILTYHVLQGRIMSSELGSIAALRTLEGGTLSVQTKDGVMIQGAQVVKADVAASNGVIHVIDTVLIPEPTKTAASM